MIKRSVLLAVVLLLIYAAYVSYGHPVVVSQHQWQDNVIRAQMYSYNDSLKKKDVVLGTSLTAMMDPAMLPKDVYMLAYPGLSVVNGINTLKENNVAPEYVFIEENAILRPYNINFDDYVFDDINYYSKKYFPFLRDCYQPLGQVAQFVEKHSPQRIQLCSDYFVNPAFRLLQGDTIATIDKEAHYIDLQRRRNIVDTAMLTASFKLLQKEVKWLTDRGSKVYFFETPISPEVFRCKQRKAIMEGFPKYFSPGKYHYFKAQDISKYKQLHDGLHLDPPSAVKYARIFSDEINNVRGRN